MSQGAAPSLPSISEPLLDYALLRETPRRAFRGAPGFPWRDFDALLTPSGFARLLEEFPSRELFDFHRGLERGHGQRPHDRYYLAYEHNFYHGESGSRGTGSLAHDELSPTWRSFIEELQGELYQGSIRRLLGARSLVVRFAWHMGISNSEVSPHLDAPEKLGTHIFFFNTQKDWDPAWGGETLVLQGRKTRRMNPGVRDFRAATRVEILDNRSFLFRNTSAAWHAVEPLRCPADNYRRLFNVIFEAPASSRKRRRTVWRAQQFARALGHGDFWLRS